MAIIPIGSANIINSRIKLHPKRRWISGSNGVTGSVRVFYNSSETVKDSIDTRLELSQIKPFSDDSLEARRLEVYGGLEPRFGSGRVFVEREIYHIGRVIFKAVPDHLSYLKITDSLGNVAYLGFHSSADGNNVSGFAYEDGTSLTVDSAAKQTAFGVLIAEDRANLVNQNFAYLYNGEYNPPNKFGEPILLGLTSVPISNFKTNVYGNGNFGIEIKSTYNDLAQFKIEKFNDSSNNIVIIDPVSVGENFNPSNVEPGLALLLDGASPNESSENWPPEIKKEGVVQLNLNFAHQGYSDLTEHPRNKTTKSIKIQTPTSSSLSSGSLILQNIYRNISPGMRKSNFKTGPYYVNYNCLNFFQNDSYRNTAIHYPNRIKGGTSGTYNLNLSRGFTFDFWIKPTTNQTYPGSIFHLHNRYNLMIKPKEFANLDGKPTSFCMGFWHGENATEFKDHTTAHWESPSTILPNQWNHISLTWGPADKFNNGNLIWVINHTRTVYSSSAGGLSPFNQSLAAYTGNQSTSKHSSNETFFEGSNLAIGARFNRKIEGSAISGYYPYEDEANFVNSRSARRQGIVGSGPKFDKTDRDVMGFGHPSSTPATQLSYGLNSELMEMRIWNHPRTYQQIIASSSSGLTSKQVSEDLIFYLPLLYSQPAPLPYYPVIQPAPTNYSTSGGSNINPDGYPQNMLARIFESAPQRQKNIHAGPFSQYKSFVDYNQEIDSSIDLDGQSIPAKWECWRFASESLRTGIMNSPFNTNHAYVGNIPSIMKHPFLKEWVNNEFPYVHEADLKFENSDEISQWRPFVTGSSATTPNFLKMRSWKEYGRTTKANNLIWPCDNGNFTPNWQGLLTASNAIYLGHESRVSFKGLGDNKDFFQSKYQFLDDAYDFKYQRDENGDNKFSYASISTEGQELDLSALANAVELYSDEFDSISPLQRILDIPQIFYGDSIKPGSVKIISRITTGSEIPVYIELKDDAEGNLYRCQTSGSIAAWNKVGEVFYEKGLIAIQSPNIYYCGLFDIDVSFQGTHVTNVQEINVPIRTGIINSSSNSTHRPDIKASSSAAEFINEDFVFISEVYLHDDNLNVVAKAKLSQPLIKRNDDSYLLRLKMDY